MKESSKGKRQFFKLQFSLRMLLLVFVVGCAAIGWYIVNRSQTFPVPAVADFDEASGARVLEVIDHRAYWFADSIRANTKKAALQDEIAYGLPDPEEMTPAFEAARVAYMLEDLNRIYFRRPRDMELIDAYPDEFEAAARDAIVAPRFFGDAAHAAAALARLGDSTQVSDMLDLYVSNGRLPHELYDMCICFSRKQTAANPRFIEELKTHIADPKCSFQYRTTFAEQLIDVDPEILATVHSQLSQGTESPRDSILWLVENRPSDEVFQTALSYLSNPVWQKNYFDSSSVLEAILKSDHFEAVPAALQMKIVSETEKLALLHQECFREVVAHGGLKFDPFVKRVISNPLNGDQLSLAFYHVERLIPEAEYLSVLRASLRESKYADSIFERCVRSLGEEESLAIVKSRWDAEKTHWAFVRICGCSKPNQKLSGEFFIQAFEASLQRDPDVYDFVNEARPFEVVKLAREFGYEELAVKLANQLPETEDYWFEHTEETQQYLDWFNDHFEVEVPLTTKDVFAADSLAECELRDKPGAFWIKNFKVAVFQAAGFGRVIDPENWRADGGLFADISKLAGESFKIETHDMVNGNRVRLLIDDSVYEFSMSQNWSWYATAPASDVLNAILQRRRIEERFFVFQEPYGNSYVKFVLFAKPSKVEAFVSQHPEFKVESGCEKYWE